MCSSPDTSTRLAVLWGVKLGGGDILGHLGEMLGRGRAERCPPQSENDGAAWHGRIGVLDQDVRVVKSDRKLRHDRGTEAITDHRLHGAIVVRSKDISGCNTVCANAFLDIRLGTTVMLTDESEIDNVSQRNLVVVVESHALGQDGEQRITAQVDDVE